MSIFKTWEKSIFVFHTVVVVPCDMLDVALTLALWCQACHVCVHLSAILSCWAPLYKHMLVILGAAWKIFTKDIHAGKVRLISWSIFGSYTVSQVYRGLWWILGLDSGRDAVLIRCTSKKEVSKIVNSFAKYKWCSCHIKLSQISEEQVKYNC